MKRLSNLLIGAALAMITALAYIPAYSEVNEYGTEWNWNKGEL